jgi:hypothetical protein
MFKDYVVKKEEWKELSVEKVNEEAMTAFFLRNQIPFDCRRINNGKYIYLVRDGIDYIDSCLFALKCWGDLNDLDIINEINGLEWDRNFLWVKYDYECYGCKRTPEDEAILEMFVGQGPGYYISAEDDLVEEV